MTMERWYCVEVMMRRTGEGVRREESKREREGELEKGMIICRRE
jgi:hypothetical protein